MEPNVKHDISMSLTHQDMFELLQQTEIERCEKGLEAIAVKIYTIKTAQKEMLSLTEEAINKLLAKTLKSQIDKVLKAHFKTFSDKEIKLKCHSYFMNPGFASILKEGEKDISILAPDVCKESHFLNSKYAKEHMSRRYRSVSGLTVTTFYFTTEKTRGVKENAGFKVHAQSVDSKLSCTYTETVYVRSMVEFKKITDKFNAAMEKDKAVLKALLIESTKLTENLYELLYDSKKLKARFMKSSLSKSADGRALLGLMSTVSTMKLIE